MLSPTEKIFFDHLLEEVLSKQGLDSKYFAKLFEESNEQELETIRMFLRFFQTPDFLVSFIEQMEILKPDQIGLKYLLATSYHRTKEFSKLQEIIRRTPLPETVGDITGEAIRHAFKKPSMAWKLKRVQNGPKMHFQKPGKSGKPLHPSPLLSPKK